jgi:hypothetical protein
LQVTQIGSDTIANYLNNIVSFTTIGPVVFENYTFSPSDTVPNPGDKLNIKLSLKNEGLVTTASDMKAKIISLNSFATVNSDAYLPLSDIKPGESKTSRYCTIEISENCPDNTEIPFVVDITSNDTPFWSDTFSIPVVPQATMINTRENIPQQFSLYQNYPNPFNPSTMINYQLPMSNDVELSIYNPLGQKVATLVSEKQKAGYHQVKWDASRTACPAARRRAGMASGIYLYRLRAGEYIETRKMILMK